MTRDERLEKAKAIVIEAGGYEAVFAIRDFVTTKSGEVWFCVDINLKYALTFCFDDNSYPDWFRVTAKDTRILRKELDRLGFAR